MPVNRVTRVDPEPFPFLLLQRLRLPLLLFVRSCPCGRLLDALGHHRAAELGWRGFAAESAVGQICSEGEVVCPCVMLRNLDVSAPPSTDGRRLEVVAEELTLFGGCQ